MKGNQQFISDSCIFQSKLDSVPALAGEDVKHDLYSGVKVCLIYCICSGSDTCSECHNPHYLPDRLHLFHEFESEIHGETFHEYSSIDFEDHAYRIYDRKVTRFVYDDKTETPIETAELFIDDVLSGIRKKRK